MHLRNAPICTYGCTYGHMVSNPEYWAIQGQTEEYNVHSLEKPWNQRVSGRRGGCISGVKVGGSKRTIDILEIDRVSMIRSVECPWYRQECLWFRARVSIVLGKSVYRAEQECPSCRARMSVVWAVECPSYRARMSIMYSKSVHGSGQECLSFRARMSIVQAVECPSYRARTSIVRSKNGSEQSFHNSNRGRTVIVAQQ